MTWFNRTFLGPSATFRINSAERLTTASRYTTRGKEMVYWWRPAALPPASGEGTTTQTDRRFRALKDEFRRRLGAWGA